MLILNYDTNKFPFYEYIQEKIEINNLAHSHFYLDRKYGVPEIGKDQHTELHEKFYDQIENSSFIHTYSKIIQDIHYLLYPGVEIYYQKIPTFRVQFPESFGVAGFHRDSDYNHNPNERNFLVGIANCSGTATIHVESEVGKKDFEPINVGYGQILLFDGANLEHGNVLNKTNKTRISFDFRISLLDPSSTKYSVSNRVPMNLQNYWIKQ